jgi:transposase
MPGKNAIRLSVRERKRLHEVITTGERSARTILRAHILLRSSDGWTDEAVARALDTSVATVSRTRQRAVERGAVAALVDQLRPGAPPKLTLEEEARLVALACSDPPDGRCRWTVRLLAEEAVGRELIRPVVPETVRHVLQKTRSSRGKSRVGVMPRSRPSSWRA